MSMPSDMTSDITDAVENIAPEAARKAAHKMRGKRSLHLTREQSGIAVAAIVAFVGVALAGPALARVLEKQKRLEARIARRARDAHHRARAAGHQAQKRLRRLSDQTFRR